MNVYYWRESWISDKPAGRLEFIPLTTNRGPTDVGEGVIDWRTIDPATPHGEGLPVEELLAYREKLDELLRDHPGKYVVIAGREIVGPFGNLDAAARCAAEEFAGKQVLIKKVEATAPVRTIGGAVPTLHFTAGAEIG